mgnify:CR=1 FL=1
MNIHRFFSGTKEKKGTPGQKGNPGHFAMKFVNLRNRERQPSFVTIKVPDIKFKIDSLSCELKKGTIKVNSSEKDVVQHIALAFVTSTLYLLVQPRPPVIPKGAIGQVQAWAKKANGKNVRQFFYLYKMYPYTNYIDINYVPTFHNRDGYTI